MRDDVSYTNNNNIPNWLAVHWQLILAEASNNLIYFLKRIWFDSVVCSAFSSIHPMVNLSLTFQRHPSKTTSASHDCLVEILLIRRDGARRWHRRCVYVNDDGKQHFQWKSCSFSSFLSLSLASISIPVFFCLCIKCVHINLPRWDSTFLLLQLLWCKRLNSRLEASTFAVYCTVDYT